MRCFYHPEVESVGLCQECGKSACHTCIEDVGGAMRCRGCIARGEVLREHQREEEERQEQDEWTYLRQQARKRIRWSYVFGLFGVGFFSVFSLMAASQNVSLSVPGIIGIPLGGYMLWSIYWGFVWFWPKWRAGVSRFRQALNGWMLFARPFVWIMILIFYVTLYLSIPLSIAIYYGVFGGGIYQFRKHRRLAASIESVTSAV